MCPSNLKFSVFCKAKLRQTIPSETKVLFLQEELSILKCFHYYCYSYRALPKQGEGKSLILMGNLHALTLFML